MSHSRRRHRECSLRLEALEDRRLLSNVSGLLGSSATTRPGTPAVVQTASLPRVRVDPTAVGVIRDALLGRGPGAEFGALLRRQVGNVNSVISGFLTGRRTEFTTPGVVVKIPRWQETYEGVHYDHLTATAAGAIWMRSGQFQIGAVMRGPFDEAEPAFVVFGIDRGAGASRGSYFGVRPEIKPDLIITLRVGPYGTEASGTILDLTDGTTRVIDPARIQVQGAVVRAFLDREALPSRGSTPARFQFAVWTSRDPDAGVSQVGSFLPENRMIRVGIEPRARLPWLNRR